MRILAFVLSALLTGSPLIAGKKLKLHKISGIPGEYMVVLLGGETPNDVPKLAKELGKEYGVEIGFTWNNALDGFTCRGTDGGAFVHLSAAAGGLENDCVFWGHSAFQFHKCFAICDRGR